MSIKHKYVEPVLIFLAVYIFHNVFRACSELIFIYAYNYLAEVIPNVVKTANPMTAPDQYAVYLKAVATFGAVGCLGILNYLSLRLDNKKFELIISKTDGKYRLKDGIRIYLKEFLKSDIISSTVPVAIFTAAAYFIPKKLLDYGLIYVFGLGASLADHYGLVGGVVLATVCSCVIRLLCVPFAVRTWRALWLSGSV